MMDQATELLNQGIAAVRAGEREQARSLLLAALRVNPQSELAWLWLSGVLDDPAQKRDCLKRVLAINPSNTAAQRGLEKVESESAPRSPAGPEAKAGAGEQQPPPGATISPPPPPRFQLSETASPQSLQPFVDASDLDRQQQLAQIGLMSNQQLEPAAVPVINTETGIPTYARLPPPTVGPCFFCSAPNVEERCLACELPQSYDCPRCGLPIDLRAGLACRCGETLQPYIHENAIDHERLGDRYEKERYTAAAIKQWELALPQSSKPQALHKKLATAYLDVGLIEKAREHAQAARGK